MMAIDSDARNHRSDVEPTRGPESLPHEREPFTLGLFGITLGLAGLGGDWLGAVTLLGAPTWPDEIFYAISAALWVTFTAVYLYRGAIRPRAFRRDLVHPFAGPLTAYIPTVAILLAAHYSTYFPRVGPWVTVGFVGILAVMSAQLVAHWLMGNLQIALLQGAYLIPVVAGPFVSSIGLSIVGFHQGASWAFGAALFFWVTFGTIVMFRLMTGPKLPTAAVPTAAAFLATSASAALAWAIAHPGPVGEPMNFLTGILFTMLLVQAVLILDYRHIPFGLSYWIFAFPIASTSNFLIRWLAASAGPGWQTWAWIVLALGSLFIVTVGIGTLLVSIRRFVGRT
jgi:tellurite resistance protein